MNRKIGIGVLWNLASMLLTRGASTIFMLFLARLIAPEAFGLLAMATVVFELASVFVNSGLGQAVIRSKSVSDVDLSTVFYTNLALSGLAYLILFPSAPYVANFYGQPELTAIIQTMGLVVFINATTVVQRAVLSRRMDFKSQMKANSVAVLGSGILAVSFAYLGWGVWSLVVMVLSQALFTSLILWLQSSWRPSLTFSKHSFSRLFRFGRNLLAEGLLNILFQNSYVLVIGRFFSAEVTGFYFFAKKVSDLISHQLTGAVQQATFPALSTLQDDNMGLLSKYRQIMQLMMFMIAPIMALLGALAAPLFALLFGERWDGAVPYLQLLCVVGTIYPLHALNINLLNVKGRSDLVLKVGLIKKFASLILLFLAIPYGVTGIVISQVVASILAVFPNTYFSSRLVGYSVTLQLKDVLKPVFSSGLAIAFSSLIIYFVPFGKVMQSIVYIITFVFLYFIVCLAVKAEGVLVAYRKIKRIVSFSN